MLMPLMYFKICFVLVLLEWLLLGQYLIACLKGRMMGHLLFYSTVAGVSVLSYELIRLTCILRGLLPPELHVVFVWGVENIPFAIVNYAIYHRLFEKIYRKVWFSSD